MAAVPHQPGIGIRVGDPPIGDLAFRIIGARDSPRTGRTLIDRHVRPSVPARLARRRGGIEFPQLFAGPRIMGGDETELALALRAGAVGQDFAVRNEDSARGDFAVVGLGFPADLAGGGVERDQKAVRRGEIDHVLVDAEVLVTRRPWIDVLRIVPHVFPDQIAVGRVDSLHGAARRVHVHHAAIDHGRGLLRAGRQAPRPCHPQLTDILLVDLVERAEAMLVEGPADHQPVRWIRIRQHVVGDGLEIGNLRRSVRRDGAQQCGSKAG